MINVNNHISVKDNTAGLAKLLNDLVKMDVLVGVPEEKSGREDKTVTNSELVFIHTHGVRQKSMREEMQPNIEAKGYGKAYEMYIESHGSPLMQIPPRPSI
jgi:hypothetical protein